MKILHITNWYPSRPTPHSAPWIQNHIKALSDYTENTIFHIEIRKGNIKVLMGKNADNSSYFILYIPIEIWRLYEIISFFLVLIVLLTRNERKITAINFHIAYPNCTYLHLIKKIIKKPLIITEHWSGYHFNFNIKTPRKRKRIQRIFHNDIPVITVSQALRDDIIHFSEADFPEYIMPNIVNTEIFKYHDNIVKPAKDTLFSVSLWKWPKDPFILLKAWKVIQESNKNAYLIIGGYGPQWDDMINLAGKLGITDTVEFRGKMNQDQIAKEMNHATAFIHISKYETFSVVCAEALCCGTPVIASNVGGLKELINSENGILIENDEGKIIESVRDIIKNKIHFNQKEISRLATCSYNSSVIGKKYADALKDILEQ